MGKPEEYYIGATKADFEPANPSPGRRATNRNTVLEVFEVYHNRTQTEAARLLRNIDALKKQHDAEKAQLHADFEAEIARIKADLARSEGEKHALQAELDETKYENGELLIENGVLRQRLRADPLQRSN
jgi:cell division septum initiation protein DivIVA